MIKRLFTIPSTRRFRKRSLHLIRVLSVYGLCFILSGAISSVSAQQTEAACELLPNAPVERPLKAGETHCYQITLAAETYLRITIIPREIYVQAQFLAPDGVTDAGACLSLTGTGPTSVTAVATSGGSYRLVITQAINSTPAGRYEVKVEELRPATEQDKIRVAAEKVESEALMLVLPTNSAEQRREGIARYEEALARWRQLGDRKAELRALAYIAKNYRDRGETNAALKYAEEAIQAARAGGDRYQEANLTITFGLLYKSQGENQKALDAFNQARQLFKSLSARYGEALTVSHIGATLTAIGDLQGGLLYLEEALTTFSSIGDPVGECSILNHIGTIYRMQGDTQRGIEYYNRALAITRRNESGIVEAYSLVLLASAYLTLGDRQKALNLSAEAVKLSQTLGEALGEGDGLKLMGEAAYLAGDHQKALDYFHQSLKLFYSISERDREAKVLYSLAQVNIALGNLEAAQKQLEQALAIQESLRTKVISQQLRDTIFTSAQRSFALYIDLLQQLHKKQPASGYEALALQASERARARSLLDLLSESQADIRQGVPQDLLDLERSLQKQLNAKAAARTRLLNDKRTQAQAAASFDQEITELTARYRDVEVQIRQRSPRYAALTQPQPLSTTAIQQQLDDETVLLEFALGDNQSWLWAVTRSSINSYSLPSAKTIEPLARQVYELLTARQPRRSETPAHYQTRVADADTKLQSESAALSQLLFGQLAGKLNREWKGKRLAIVAAGALEYIPFAALPIPVAGDAVGRGQGSGISQEESRSNKVTHQDISKDRPPTTDHRPPTTDHRPLPTASPATDHRPPTTGYHPLIADHEIINLPSASVLALIRKERIDRKPADKLIAVIADPVFEPTDPRVLNAVSKAGDREPIAKVRSAEPAAAGPAASSTPLLTHTDLSRSLRSFDLLNERGGFSRLPFSREEAEAITALAATHSLIKATDFQASRSLATSGQLAQFRILHFATHGLLNSERPELSGLVLSLIDEQGKSQDGFLRMHDIYNLHLPAELIVLSACQTALGKQIKGEGLVGLTRGFMYAGAERVVASLWQVDDLATAELMKRFYRGMLKERMRPAQALRLAQLEMYKQPRWSSPYFWAAFTIQGEWK